MVLKLEDKYDGGSDDNDDNVHFKHKLGLRRLRNLF